MISTKNLFKYGVIFTVASALLLAFSTVVGDLSLATSADMGFANLATKVGISEVTAGQIIDAISAGSTLASVTSLLLTTTGVGFLGAGAFQTAKYLIKKKGKHEAAAW